MLHGNSRLVAMMWMLKDSDADSYWFPTWDYNFFTSLLSSDQRSDCGWFTTRYQFSPITSRTTTYVLFVFWCFFFFFGEFLLLVLFNFNTISDTIPSSYFLSTKNHVIFWLNVEGKLGEVIMIYICIFSFCSMNFLLRLDIDCSYNRVYRQGAVDAIFSNSIFALVQFH